MEYITTFGDRIDTLNISKDSLYVIMPNLLIEETWLSISFHKGDLGNSNNPLPAHLGFNMFSENGKKIGSNVLYYSYKAENDGYLHIASSYVKPVNAPRKELNISPVLSFKCSKDSVYKFMVYTFKEYFFLGYSETGHFSVPDSLTITDGNYQVTTSDNKFIGFCTAPNDGYFSVDVPGLKTTYIPA